MHRDVRDHEVVHRDFFSAALGTARIRDLTPDFSSINFANRISVLRTAKTFEALGVSADNSAAKHLANAAYLGVAGKIVSVEAQAVLTAADPFIVEAIAVINA